MSKRVLDLLVAVLGLIVCCPVLIVLIIAIRLDSRGRAIFVQQRVGRDGRLFACYKLRTMRDGTLELLTHLSPSDSVTGIGHVLRRSKLDELPQLYNVLKGDMSLVGPRPGLPGDDALILARRKLGVFSVRPGITGLAQVCGIDMSRPAELAAPLSDCGLDRHSGRRRKRVADAFHQRLHRRRGRPADDSVGE